MKILNESFEKLLEDTEKSRAVLLSLLEDQHLKVNELHNSQLKYESLFENSPVSLWEEDLSEVKIFLKKHCPNLELIESFLEENPDKIYELLSLIKVVDVNQATLKLYKTETKEQLFSNFDKIFTVNSLEVFKQLILRLSNSIYEYETESVNKNIEGKNFYIKLKYSIVPGYEESWERIIISVIDVTQEKEITEKLRQSELRFMEAQSVAKFGNWHIDYKTNVITRSKEIYKIIGIYEDELKPTFEAFTKLVHKDDLTEYQLIFNKSIKDQKPYEHTYRIITPNGETKYILEKGYTFFNEKNEPLRTVGTAQDITENYLAEVKLQESQLQYQVLFDSAPIALFEEDFTEVIKNLYELGARPENISQLLDDPSLLQQCLQLIFVNNVNQESLKLFKANSKEHFHQSLPTLFTKHSIEIVKNIFIDITQGKSEGTFETLLRKVDGEVFNALVRFAVLKYNKESGKLIFSVENISHRKKLLAEIEEQQSNLNQAQKIALIGSFTLNHEDNSITRTEEFYRIFETTPQELPTREECFLSYVHPEDSKQLVKTFHESIKNNISYEMNYRIITGKGNLKYIHEKGNTYINDKGEPHKTIGTLQDITEKTNALKKIEEAQTIINNSSLVAFLWKFKKDWPVEYVSENVIKLLEYPAIDFYEANVRYVQFIHPEEVERVKKFEKQARVLAEKNDLNFDTFSHEPYRIITKSGHTKWVLDKTIVRRDANNNITHFQGFIEDITEKHFAEIQLEKIHQLLEDTLSDMTDGFVTLNKDWIYTFVNQQAASYLNKSVKELQGAYIWDIFPDGINKLFHLNCQKAFEFQESIIYEEYFDDTQRWFENRLFPSSEGLSIFFSDITDRKNIEQKTKEAHNIIINSNSIAIVWENIPSWPIKYVSENIERILGYTTREMTSEIIHFSKIMQPDDLELSNKEALSFLNNPEIDDYILSPYRVYTKDGKIRWISERTNIIRDEKGKVIELRGFIDDITEQYQLENAINTILNSVSKVTGNDYLKEITIQLSIVLGAEYTFIGLNEKENPLIVSTLFNCYNGKIVENFSYNLDGTPCANVLDLSACSYPNNVANLFPEDTLLKDMGIEGYIGVPLMDSHNQPIGIMVGLYKKPIENPHFAESIIQLFSTRTSAELERLRAEEKLKESEAVFNKQLKKLNIAIDAVKDVVFMTDIKGIFTYVNEAFTLLYGYQPKELIGKLTPRILKGGLLTESDYKQLWNTLFKKQPIILEIKNKNKNGQLIDIETSLNSITNDDGEIIGFVAIQRDITEKINHNKLLEQSEKKYRDLFEKTKDATLLIKDGVFIDCNESTLKMVGFKGNKEDFLHVHPSKLSPISQPDGRLSKDKADVMMAIATKKGSHQFDWVHLKTNGEEFYAEVTLTKIETIDDTIIHCVWRDITEKKKAEEHLKESEAEGWSLFEEAPYPIWVNDSREVKNYFNKLLNKGITNIRTYLDQNPDEVKKIADLIKITKVNKSSLSFYEVESEEELFRHISDFFVAESYDAYKEEVIALFEGKLYYKNELLIKKLNGQLANIVVTASVPEIYKDTLEKVIISFVDITEQKRNEQTKEVLLNITKQISEVSSVEDFSLIVKNELSNLLDTSNFYIALYNKEKDTISIPYFIDDLYIDFEDNHEFKAEGSLTGYVIKTKKPLLATKETFKQLEKSGIIKLIGPDSQIWLGVPLFIRNEVIGAIAVQSYTNQTAFSYEDLKLLEIVSEQIAIAIERIQYQNEIKENEEKFRNIFELSPDMANLIDEDGIVLDCNNQVINQLGYQSKDEIIGKHFSHFFGDFKPDAAQHLFHSIINKGFLINEEFLLKRKDGSEFSAELSSSLLKLDSSENKRIISIARDITSHKEHEQEISNALEKAKDSDRLKSAFLANMSHEIRTPMNGIIGFAEMLQNNDLDEAKRSFYANIIMNSSRQLLSIINDVLDMSTIEAGLVEIKKSSVSINEMLKELHEFFLQKSDEKQLKLNCELSLNDELSVINTDQTKVQQVLTNFISNAIKFTRKGSVTFGYTFKDNFLEFYVTDTGIGIDKKLHNEVFERFRQVNMEYTRETIGNGLGLSISKKLVELLGGKIWLESEPNKGSTFYFTLPYQHDVLDIIEDTIIPIIQKSMNEQITILLAEDEEYNRIFIEEILDDKNFTILTAENGVEAIDIAKNHPEIMFILMDIKMPIMNGIEALKIIREFNKAVPIIALTAFSMESDKNHLIKEGFDDYVAKPIVKKDLMRILDKYVLSS
jgi:PAS domain S-box-containing protein